MSLEHLLVDYTREFSQIMTKIARHSTTYMVVQNNFLIFQTSTCDLYVYYNIEKVLKFK